MNSKVRVIIFLLCVTGISVFLNGHVLGRYSKYFFQLQDTSPCACEKCLSEDDLNFFNKSVEPFLSANYILSEDTFNWWKRLQNEARNFSTYKTTVDRLFQMFPPGPDVKEPSPDLCRTCAVVGNSRNLKGSHYGPLIDVNDIIMRINFGHTKGFEADVGTRTTHQIMYPESAMDLDNNSTHLVLIPFKIKDLEWLLKAFPTGKSYGPVKSKIKANKDLVMLINPAFMRYVHEVWLEKKGKYPSTGFMAFVLALHICDEVHVFGFGADKYRNWSHYWEKLKDSNLKTGPHPGTDEYRIIQKVAEQQKIKFYTGW
ncbi:CMP-N-acetylneuraminate-beta-galactosamide-alpha-2,3-sialyltransferase 1-like isoform X1 [Siniperca chuatsi]|uniref:CMP-N-acetylneuraminate-beta-galactosamide- alpha-2,3-sialyltransferase 1-like isoform X1 n=1 Tax=Siniperca chuatsi TaxID=119488 RepID=UPI001CE125A0|nr:CMP-N-acetylneuraminate-beta-galactosamide-alpha-2,3-sialyltransferase 1-like isoform X1 [Siniperca chuatsi]